MAADKVAVCGEGDIALDDTGAHTCAGLIRLFRVLGELQRSATMGNREVSATERAVLALQQLLFKRTLVHPLDEIERARPELYGITFVA